MSPYILNNSDLLFDPPITIAPGEVKQMDIYVGELFDNSDELGMDFYDVTGKHIVARSKRKLYF